MQCRYHWLCIASSGIAQLHWCLRFLLDLKNTEGEYTGDVNVCIQAVEDDLIEQYAKLGTALENQEAPDGKNPTIDKEGDESGKYVEGEKVRLSLLDLTSRLDQTPICFRNLAQLWLYSSSGAE